MIDILKDIFTKDLIQIIISNAKQGDVTKVKIRPVLVKESLMFQKTEYIGTKVIHENLDSEKCIKYCEDALETSFKQAQIQTQSTNYSILVSKKGKVTVAKKHVVTENIQPADEGRLLHNRKKKYLLEEGTKVDFLVDLGVMTQEGKIVNSKYDKFKQINRFLEFIEDIVPKLDKDREITIIDFGCGKSYLTFAIYYFLRELRGFDVKIIGLDLKDDVINKCNSLSKKYGYDKLEFIRGDIAQFTGVTEVDMVVTLHACDTATDFALKKAVAWGAKVILSVPCCQHEINKQIKNDLLSPILQYGILKERMSAIITDGLRAKMLEQQGYDTQILEFIDMDHTPKNLLIRAVKNKKKMINMGERNSVERLIEELHINPTIFK